MFINLYKCFRFHKIMVSSYGIEMIISQYLLADIHVYISTEPSGKVTHIKSSDFYSCV